MGYFLAELVIDGTISFPTGVPSYWLNDTRMALKQYVLEEYITISQYEELTKETYTP